jgi:phosphoglycerate dehydrogenase-like enzyme
LKSASRDSPDSIFRASANASRISTTPSPARLARSPALRAVVVPYAGIPQATRGLLAARPGIALHNLHHNAAPTAEMATALLLAAARTIVPADRALRRGDWTPRYASSRDVLCDGSTAVVLGYGAVGRRVAAACRGLGMNVTAVRRTPDARPDDGPAGIAGPDALPSLLPRANVLVICLPLTPDTEGLLGARELRALPDGAVLVNVGRASIVDEAALFAELASGRIAAGLDVWYRYPESEAARTATPPADQPFGALDNVVLSPHRAGHSARIEELRARALAELLAAAARGDPMPNRVDPVRGY